MHKCCPLLFKLSRLVFEVLVERKVLLQRVRDPELAERAHPPWTMRSIVRSFLLLVVCAMPAMAAEEPIALDSAVTIGRMENGLTYYIQHNAKPAGRVELRLVVNAGSALEDDDQQGLAHLIEHLCFRGTKHFPNAALVGYLQSVGSDFGPHVNGFTNFDETVYKLSLPSDSEEALGNGIKVLRDWAGAVDFSPEQVEKERRVVVEEWRIGRGADQRMAEKSLPVVFKGSRYADRLPIGKKEVVETAPINVIQRFYRDWYRPDNMAVVIVGDVDVVKIEALLRSTFKDFPRVDRPRAKPNLTIPINDAPVYSVVSDPESIYNLVRLSFPQPSSPVTTLSGYRGHLAQIIALQATNARFAALTEQAAPPFHFANSDFGISLARSRSDFTLLAIVSDEDVQRGLAALVKENERIRRYGFTPEELVREKSKLLKSLEEHYAERDNQESEVLAQTYVTHYLQNEAAPSPEFRYINGKAALEQISLNEVNQVYRTWVDKRGAVVRIETTEKPGVKLAKMRDIQETYECAEAAPSEPYQEKKLSTSLVALPPTPGTIVSRKTIADIGVIELMLSNGVRVILKPSHFKKDEVLFSAYRPGGQSSVPEEYDLAAKVASGYVAEAGLGDFSKTDLQKHLAGKSVQVGTMIDASLDLMKGRCSAADLETILQLVHLYFGEPRRDENVYKAVLAMNNTFETNVVMNPVLSFLNEIQDIRFKHHPRMQRLVQPENAWKELTLDKVLQAYRNRFGTANGYTFIFVGSFTADTIEPLIARYLGGLPAGDHAERWKDLGIRSIPGPFAQTVERGQDPKSLVYNTYQQEANWTLPECHLLWSLGNILERSLLDKLRIETGGVYTLKVMSTLEKIPFEHYDLEVALPCAPDDVEKLSKGVDDEIERIVKTGPSVAEVEKEVESQKRAVQMRAENNSDWLWQLELIYKYEEGYGRLSTPYAMSQLVTAENLHDVARKFWRTDKWVSFILRPETPSPITVGGTGSIKPDKACLGDLPSGN